MTVVAVGVDVVDVARFALVLRRRPTLRERLFTDAELVDAHDRPERLAARFAAKEAILKALSVGMGAVSWRSMEIRSEPGGAPKVVLHDGAARLARIRHVDQVLVSLSHTAHLATAFVVATSECA